MKGHCKLVTFLLLLAANVAPAQPPDATIKPHKNGAYVVVCNVEGMWRLSFYPTNDEGTVIDATGWPKQHDCGLGFTPTVPSITLTDVPITVQGSRTGIDRTVHDLQHKAEKFPVGGTFIAQGTSDLSIEAVHFDVITGLFALEPIFAVMAFEGKFGPVPVPSLFADTNADGILGENDILFSLVDLNLYLSDIPSFLSGDIFTIVGGVSPDLPGMLFSTTAFAFDPTAGFTGTAFTGQAEVTLVTELFVTPEPGSIALLGSGILCLMGLRMRRRV